MKPTYHLVEEVSSLWTVKCRTSRKIFYVTSIYPGLPYTWRCSCGGAKNCLHKTMVAVARSDSPAVLPDGYIRVPPEASLERWLENNGAGSQ